jgi:hypothetical protein
MGVRLFCLVAIAGMVSAAGIRGSARPPVTVILDFEKPHSNVSLRAMREEVQRLLGNAGLRVEFRLKRDLPDAPEFSDLVLFRMRGSCTMDAWAPGHPADYREPLAMAYSDGGQVLHFGEVACDRVRESLQRVLGRGASEKYEAVLGNALGMVVAHEMYHMLADTKEHTKQGITKGALSARELLSGDLSMPRVAQEAMQNAAGR